MFRLLGRGSRPAAPPPVLVPEGALRPGEDDRALVAAVADYLSLMRNEGGRGWSELDAEAVEIGAADAYLNAVEQVGHAGWLATADPATMLRAEVALELAAPDFAALVGEAADLVGRRKPDWAALARLDQRFFDLGGRGAVDGALAARVAGLDRLQVVPDAEFPAGIAALCEERELPEQRRRDLLLERLERRLTEPFEAAVSIILCRAAGVHAPVYLAPGRPAPRDDGQPVTEWLVEAGGARYRALPLTDRVVVRSKAPGGGWQALGHIDFERIARAIDWAREGEVAQAALMGLEELDLADRVATLAFESARPLKRTGAEAAAFHLGLDGARDLAVVVFPNVTALIDPASNGRLAEFHRATLSAEAEARRERLAQLS